MTEYGNDNPKRRSSPITYNRGLRRVAAATAATLLAVGVTGALNPATSGALTRYASHKSHRATTATTSTTSTTSTTEAADQSDASGNSSTAQVATTTPTTAPPVASSSDSSPSGWTPTFEDDFNGTSLNSAWGVYENGNNDGIGVRRTSAIHVNNGQLDITGSGDVGGGMMLKNCPTYGRFEVRASMDDGAGFGPAIMLWPGDDDWPYHQEVDISEIPDGNRQWAGHYIHYGSDSLDHIAHLQTSGDYSQWHTYTVEWTPGKLAFYQDGTLMPAFQLNGQTISNPITNSDLVPSTPHCMTLQNDVGGNGFIDGPNSSTPSQVSLHVDYVKMWKQQ